MRDEEQEKKHQNVEHIARFYKEAVAESSIYASPKFLRVSNAFEVMRAAADLLPGGSPEMEPIRSQLTPQELEKQFLDAEAAFQGAMKELVEYTKKDPEAAATLERLKVKIAMETDPSPPVKKEAPVVVRGTKVRSWNF